MRELSIYIGENFYNNVGVMPADLQKAWDKILNNKNNIRVKSKDGRNIILISGDSIGSRGAIYDEDELNKWFVDAVCRLGIDKLWIEQGNRNECIIRGTVTAKKNTRAPYEEIFPRSKPIAQCAPSTFNICKEILLG